MPTDADLRALVTRLRRDGSYFDPYAPETLSSVKSDGRKEAYLELADDLESLLRPQEPEQAVRERLVIWHDPVANVWVGARGNERALSQGESPQGALAALLDAIDLLDAAERSRT